MEDFNAFISDMSLFDCKPNNGLFTWTNMRKHFSQIVECLDRFLLSSNGFDSDIEFFSSILPLSGSNHFLVSLTVVRDRSSFKIPFKFEPMWFRDTSFLPLLHHWWEEAPFLRGFGMFQLVKKIRFLKKNIGNWNSLHFKNIFEEKQRTLDMLEVLNRNVLQHGLGGKVLDEIRSLRSELDEILAREEVYWRQKSRELWLADGDKNTNFFHASTKMKRVRSRISCIQDSQGNILLDDEDVSREAVKFFKNLLSSKNIDVSNNIPSFIPSLVSPEDNKMLMSLFSLDEVKRVVFAMNPDKAPGPDGFTPLFFQKC
ncbi:uncharacterized protein LOC131858981 [Cryptomeria japonica]|uniref:uncharacterized protein LOC131858981 n=1 Tax=Cryptomeria japonica TaxID=3369 RepID=UPI0027DA92A1|nr:uncharacterized protein LOC131858981 [Cryptomeria japonica]